MDESQTNAGIIVDCGYQRSWINIR